MVARFVELFVVIAILGQQTWRPRAQMSRTKLDKAEKEDNMTEEIIVAVEAKLSLRYDLLGAKQSTYKTSC
jgi:hypothetical protein